jgi:hypothetical protein
MGEGKPPEYKQAQTTEVFEGGLYICMPTKVGRSLIIIAQKQDM